MTPDNAKFFWGAATSAHQVEGENHNDWTEWERSEARIKNLESRIKEPNFKEQFPSHLFEKWPTPADLKNYISGRACDHYNRFKEDFDIAKQLGHNAHRFSIEWSRIEPEEGKWNEKEIEHYREVIRALKERGLEPFVTLWHWTIPTWLADKGGWLSADAINNFQRFVQKIAEEFSPQVKFWCVLNEPVVFTSYAYVIGVRPPQNKNFWRAILVFHNLARAHRRAYRILHQVARKQNYLCFVGIAKHNKRFIAGSTKMIDRFLARVAKSLWNNAFMWHIRSCQDFVGLNYYNQDEIRFNLSVKYAGLYNLSNSPDGFYWVIMDAARHKKPIYILENGLDDAGDVERSTFISEHLQALKAAIKNGADVRGYFYWSLLDNFEWENGFWPRFGLVEVDYKTMERKIRPSAWEYARLIAKSKGQRAESLKPTTKR